MSLLLCGLVVVTVVVATIAYRTRRCCYPKTPPFPPVGPHQDELRPGLRLKEVPEQADAVVIGAGPSGLTAAVLLARTGRRVVCFEQHDRVGGGLHTFEEKGFEFDTGFHYSGELGEGQPLKSIINDLTGNLADFAPLDGCSIDPGIYDEVDILDEQEDPGFKVRAGKVNWVADLKAAFPEEKEAIDAYMREVHDYTSKFLVYQIWRSFPSWLRRITYRFMAATCVEMAQETAAHAAGRHTKNLKLAAILHYLSLGCCGVLPRKLNAGIMMGLHQHMSDGAYYPIGGPSVIARGMMRELLKAGGRCFVRAPVEKITTSEGKVTGVRLVRNGVEVAAPLVITTAGLHATINRLLDEAGQTSGELQEKMEALPSTPGHIFGFVGLRGDCNEIALPNPDLDRDPSSSLQHNCITLTLTLTIYF